MYILLLPGTCIRSVAMLDPVVIFLISICLSYVVGNFVFILSTLFTFVIAVVFRLEKLKVMMKVDMPQYVVVFVTGLITMISQVAWIVSSVFFYAMPFVIICTLLSLVHSNHAPIVAKMIDVYNSNISTSPMLIYFRQGLLMLKLFAESILPLYNFLVNMVGKGVMDVLNVILGNAQMTQRIMQLSISVLNMAFEIFQALGKWKVENISRCGSISAVALENDYCLHYVDGARALSLTEVENRYREVGVEFQSIITILCPAIAPIMVVVLYPLIDVITIRIMENIGNLMLALLFTTWDVTALRCKIAKESSSEKGYAKTSLCAVDAGPLFDIAKLAVDNIGTLVDNWLQHTTEFVIKFFYVTDDLQYVQSQGILGLPELHKKFPAHVPTRALVLTSSIYAVTDGVTMHVYDRNAIATPTFRVTVQPPVQVAFGVAPVTYMENELFDDGRANYQTGVFGCACSDANEQVQISCTVAHARKLSAADQTPESNSIDVHFQNPYTGGILRSCAHIMIHVQPLRFEERFVGPDRNLENLWEAENDELLQTECMKNWRECSSADAVIYVQPICDGNALGTALCIDHFQASCFPYCIGYHQRGVGALPITLYKKSALTNGVLLANVDCSVELPTLDGSKDVQTMTAYGSYGTVSDVRMQAPKPAQNALCYRATNAGATLQAPLDISGFEVRNTQASEFFILNGQAVVFAGNLVFSMVDPIQTGGELEYSGSIDLSMTSYNNFYQLKRDIQGIPIMKIREAQRLGAYSARLFVPEYSMDTRLARIVTVGAQVPNGFVYAVNPSNLDLQTTNIKGTRIIEVDNFIRTRIFLAKPRLMCTKSKHLYQENQHAQPVYVNCLPNVIREIKLDTGSDQDEFIKYVDDLSTVRNKVVNYYVYEIQMLDAVNVLITTVSGEYNDWPEAFDTTQPCMVCKHVHYYLHIKTLQVQRERPWPQVSVEKQYFIPQVGTLMAKGTSFWITALSVAVNKYLLNFMGLVEEIISNDLNTKYDQSLLCTYALRHSAYENCQIQPLSVQSAYIAFVKWEQEVARFCRQLVMWFEVFTGVPTSFGSKADDAFSLGLEQDPGLIRAAGGGIATSIRGISTTALTAMSLSTHAAFFIYDDLILECIRRYLMTFLGTGLDIQNSATDVFYTFILVMYNAIDGMNSAYDTKIVSQGSLICRHMGALLGDSIEKPLGSFIFHSCVSTFLFPKAIIRYLSSIIILFPASKCICLDTDIERITGDNLVLHRCYRLLPPNLKQQLQNGRTGVLDTCTKSIQVLEQEMYQAPLEFWQRLDLAITSVRGIPNQLAEWFSIPTFLGMECGDIQNTADSLVLLPKPMSEFRRCAFTATCFDKCRSEIDSFYNHLDKAANPNVPHTRVELNVPVQLPTVKIGWKVVALENYGNMFMPNCINNIYMLLFRMENGQNYWKFMGYCHLRGSFAFEMVYEFELTKDLPPDLNTFDMAPQLSSNVVRDIRFVPGHGQQIPIIFLVENGESKIEQFVFELLINLETRTGLWHELFNALLFTLEEEVGGCKFLVKHIMEADGLSSEEELALELYTNEHDGEISREGRASAVHMNRISGMFILPATGGYNVFARVRIYYSHVVEGVPDPGPRHRVMLYRITRRVSTPEDMRCIALKYATSSRADVYNVGDFFQYARNTFAILWANENKFVVITKEDNGVIHLKSQELVNAVDSNYEEDSFYTAAPRYALLTDSTFAQGASIVDEILRNGMLNFERKYSTRPIFSTHIFKYDKSNAAVNPILRNDMRALVDGDSWFSAYAVRLSTDNTYSFVYNAHTESSSVAMKETCTHTACGNCNSEELRQLCYIAERCTLRRCVGTLLDTNNAFCATGAFMAYALEFMSAQHSSLFYIVTEILIVSVRTSVGFVNQQQSVDIISMSNYYNTNICQVKDVLMSASALLPSFLYTLFRMAQQAQQAITRTVFSQMRFWETQVIEVEPADLKGASMATRVVSQLIAQVLMGAIFLFLRDGDIFLCATTEMVEFLEGIDIDFVRDINANIVRNMGTLNVDTATHGDVDICDVGFKDDLSATEYTKETDEMRTIARLRGTLSPNSLSSTIESEGISLSALKNAFDNFGRLKSNVQRLYARMKWSNAIKWIIGITYAFSDLMVYANLDACVINDAQFTNVLSCACGDLAYAIPDANAQQSLGWCTGVLRLKTYGGETVHLYNPYSYAYLKEALEAYARLVVDGSSTEDLEKERINLYNVAFPQMSANKYNIPPLSVLMACRNNYWYKTWDRGVFAGFYTAIDFSPDSDTVHRERMSQFLDSTALSVDRANIVKNCLRQGPTINTATACTELMYSTMNAYFVYTEHDQRMLAVGNDACGYLSNANAPRACKAVDALSPSCSEGTTLQQRCPQNQNTININNMAFVNLVNNFKILNHQYNDDVIETARDELRTCTVDTFVIPWRKKLLPSPVDENALERQRFQEALNVHLKLKLVTNEGDVLHNYADCVMLGPYTRRHLLPVDSQADEEIENLLYAKLAPTNGTCPSRTVFDMNSTAAVSENLQTCGTSARIAVIKYIQDQMTSNNFENLKKEIEQVLIANVLHVENPSSYTSLENAKLPGKHEKTWKDVFQNTYIDLVLESMTHPAVSILSSITQHPVVR